MVGNVRAPVMGRSRMRISQISEGSPDRVGLSAKAMRCCEAARVVPPPARLTNGYRDYDEADEASLRIVAAARALDLSLADIRDLTQLAASGDRPCSRLAESAHQHRATVRDPISQLRHLEARLEARLDEVIDRATAAAAGPAPRAAMCPVLVGSAARTSPQRRSADRCAEM
jgi:DNA-binding transcriptional MerR regulator